MGGYGVPIGTNARGNLHKRGEGAKPIERADPILPLHHPELEIYLLLLVIMPSFTTKIGACALGLTSLASSAVAAPSSSYKDKASPFSNASWPLPRTVTGDDQGPAYANTTTQGWGECLPL